MNKKGLRFRSPEVKVVRDIKVFINECNVYHSAEMTIVFTSGVFDVYHEGHSKYLLEARRLGDVLVVGVDNDSLAKKNKGIARPIRHEDDRAYVVASHECVDLVYIIDDDLEIIKLVRPHILVRSHSTKIKADILDKYQTALKLSGGRLVLLKPMSKINSTSLIEKIRKNG